MYDWFIIRYVVKLLWYLQKVGSHDWYCFECHHSGPVVDCSRCWRVYHSQCFSRADCIKKAIFTCPICQVASLTQMPFSEVLMMCSMYLVTIYLSVITYWQQQHTMTVIFLANFVRMIAVRFFLFYTEIMWSVHLKDLLPLSCFTYLLTVQHSLLW